MTENNFNSGANSAVYQDNINGRDVIVKICKNDNKKEEWLFCAQKELKLLTSLDTTKFTASVPTMELMEISGNPAIVQSKIAGELLSEDLFLTLSKEEQNQIAKQIAEVMYAVHNLDTEDIAEVTNNGYIPSSNPHKTNIETYFKGQYSECIKAFDGLIEPQTQKILDNYINNTFNHLDCINARVVPIHNDIRCSNVLYDSNKVKVGIIDFGGSEVNDIYHDFASIALPSSLGFKAQKQIIDEYNKLLSRDNKNYRISPEIAKIYSVAKMVYFAKIMQKSDKVKKTLFPQSTDIKIIGLEDYLTTAGVISKNEELFHKRKEKTEENPNFVLSRVRNKIAKKFDKFTETVGIQKLANKINLNIKTEPVEMPNSVKKLENHVGNILNKALSDKLFDNSKD